MSRRRSGFWCRAAVLFALATAMAAPAQQAGPAASAPARAASAAGYFKQQPAAGTLPFSREALSTEERGFLATLPVVRVGVPDPPYRPYEQIGTDGEVSGIHPEMLMALARAFGIRMVPVILPGWPATLEAARRGEVDILMTVGVSPERLRFLEFTLGATPSPAALFARSDGKPIDVALARYAQQRGFVAGDWLRRQFPRATIVEVDDTLAALQTVAEGRADYYLGALLEATDTLSRHPVRGVQALRLMNYATGQFHFAVRKDWAPLAGILNKGIQTLRVGPSGTLAAALAELPPQLRPPLPMSLPVEHTDVLARRPVWLVGAVRGLAMLNHIDDRGVHSGIAAEYVEQVARRLGVAPQIVPYDNVAAMLQGLRGGEIDLIPFLTRTTERAVQFTYSVPYVEMPYMIVARSDDTLYWGLSSLAGKRLALTAEHPLRDLIAREHPQIVVVDAAPGTGAMDLVAAGQADAAVEVKLFANLRINSDNDGRLRVVAPVEELAAGFHFAAAPRSAELIPLVNLALHDIPPAEHRRMLERWVARDLNPGLPWRRWLPQIAVGAVALVLLLGGSAWWLARLEREVKARRRADELLGDIAGTVPGVAYRYVIDAAGKLRHVYISPSARAFLGIDLARDRTVATSLMPYLREDHRAEVQGAQAASARDGSPFKVTAAFRAPGGPERWLHAEAVRTRDKKGLTVWTGYLVDVSSERELQARLAGEAQARNLMLATASHELRAPTHNLSLALQAIGAEGLSAEQARAVRIARQSAQMLAALLNDVLDAARFASGPMRLVPGPFSLHALLDELAEAWGAAAADKGLAFAVHRAADLPERIVLDSLRLKQVLINLLSNACKYTAQGRFDLHAGRDGTWLRFAVSDTGPGIAPQAQQSIFQPFVTLDAAIEKPLPSSGLGLVVCRRIAELMGGHVTLASQVGSGSVFTFELPFDAAASEQRAAEPPPARGEVVVCDDDETSRLLTAQMLRARGYAVLEAHDGPAVLAAWHAGRMRALVTDLDMPGMPGLELIARLRQQESGDAGRAAVIVCSGSPVPPREQAPAHDAYLQKPLQIDALARTLADLGVLP